jgi:hypothetical protein
MSIQLSNDEDGHTNPRNKTPQTWWQSHAPSVLGVVFAALLALVITVQVAC